MTVRKLGAKGYGLATALGVLALTGCNGLTGADDIVLAADEASEPEQPQTGGGATHPVSGAGGATGATTAVTSGVGGVSAGSTSGAGAGPMACEWPAGPYGVDEGDILPPSLAWQGYAEGSDQPGTISIQDYFDCDGSRGIDAVMIETSQYG